MNILNGLGHAAGGFARGMQMSEQIQDMKDRRDERKNKKDIDAQIKQAGVDAASGYYQEYEPITVENPTGGISPPNGQSSQQDGQLPVGLADLDYTSPSDQTQVVQRFADGGMVQDQKSMVAQVNAASPGLESFQSQQSAPVSRPKPNPGMAMSRSFSAMRDKAMELGRPDLALQYQQAGFQIRDRMYNEGIKNAQRAFDMTGDIGGFVKVYNDIIDDDAKVDGYEKTDNGYKLKINMGGNIVEREFKPEQIRDMVMSFNDPAARYAAERAAMDARNKKTFETDEDIRKENAKPHAVGLDSVLVGGDGKVIYDGSANRPKFRNDQEVYAAANDPADPRHDIAVKMIKQQHGEKVSIARESRAPKEAKQPTLEDRAYEDWKAKPENSGKGISDFLKDKASWGKDIGLDTVTTSTSTIDPVTGAETSKETRSTKVPRGQEQSKPAAKKEFNLDKYLH